MKKRVLLLILVFCMLCPILTACGSNNENGNNNPNAKSINISYIKDLTMNIGDSAAFGIKKAASNTATATTSANCYKVSLLNANLLSNNNVVEKNYLYTTTETYENGVVEYNENSITKVTFKKNTLVEENVYDSDGNLIDSNKTITQEEIPAQINKLYVNKKYMFMQFVALVDKSGDYNYYENNELKTENLILRPDELTYNENGISEFDLKNYYSSALSQSFVVDITNGNIYKITNFNIAEIHDIDIVKDSNGNYYKMSINNNRELVFSDIMPNKEVSINGVVTDKYGYTFVRNSHINNLDSINKIFYFTSADYMIDDNKQVYQMKYDAGTLMEHIEKVLVNGIEQDYSNNDIVTGLKRIGNSSQSNLIGYYKGYRVYDGKIHTPSGIMFIEDSLYYDTSVGTNIKWLNNNYVTNTLILKLNNKLYYKVVDIENCINKNIELLQSDFTKISDSEVELYIGDYYMQVGNNKIKITNVYSEQTLTGTKYYKLTQSSNIMELVLLKNIDYSQNVFIFQPINK